MANIKAKGIKDLSAWNKKELRKLRMTINNRISALTASSSVKELGADHPLYNLESGECRDLLSKVISAEAKL